VNARRGRHRARVVKPPEKRRAELLDAALRLFEERGYEQVSVADITAAAGIAKGTFYLYFESRERLLDALRSGYAEAAARRLDEIAVPPPAGDWGAFTDELVREAVDFQVEQYELHQLVRLPHRHDPGERPGRPDDLVRRAMERIIRAGIDAGAYVADDPAVTADLAYDLLHAAGDRACARPGDREAIGLAASAFLRRALLASPMAP